MKHKQASILFGTAISAAAIAVAIDYTKHRLPEPSESSTKQLASQQAVIIIDEGEAIPQESSNCTQAGNPDHNVSPCSL